MGAAARRAELARTDHTWRWIAAVLVGIALAAQSAGVVLLLLVGGVVRPTLPRWLLPAAGATLLMGGRGVPQRRRAARPYRARHAAGQVLLGAFWSMGRGSLPWRISQDQRALPLIVQRPVIGYGAWDCWRPLGRRPWGLPMLVIGQYGVVGLALLMIAILTGPLGTLWRGVRAERFALAVIVLLAGVDAALNSTIYFPAILFAAALAGMESAGRKAWA